MHRLFTRIICIFAILWTTVAYTQTKPSWLQLKDNPVIDARIYGVTGDGSTDDTAALQKALDAAHRSATSKKVVLPSGIFLISSQVDIWSGCSLVGNRESSVIRRNAFRSASGTSVIGPAVLLQVYQGASLSSLSVDGNRANASPTPNAFPPAPSAQNYNDVFCFSSTADVGPDGEVPVSGETATYSTRLTSIKDCSFFDLCGSAITGYPARNLLVENCDFLNYGDHAIYIRGTDEPCADVVIRNNSIRLSADSAYGNGAIKFANNCVGRSSVIGNHIYEPTPFGAALYIDSGVLDSDQATGPVFLSVVGNSFTGKYGVDMFPEGDGYLSVDIVGNNFRADVPMRMGAAATPIQGRISVVGNSFTSQVEAKSVIYIYADDVAPVSGKVFFNSNTFSDPCEIQVSTGLERFSFTNNIITANPSTQYIWPLQRLGTGYLGSSRQGSFVAANNTLIGCAGLFYETTSVASGSLLNGYNVILENNVITGDPANNLVYASVGSGTANYTGSNLFYLRNNFCDIPNASGTFVNAGSATSTVNLLNKTIRNVAIPDATPASATAETNATEINKLKAMLRVFGLLDT